MIPFDNAHPLHGKPEHVHLVDALKQMDMDSKYDPETFSSHKSPKKLYQENYLQGLALFLYNIDDVWDYSRVFDEMKDDDYWEREFPETMDVLDIESFLNSAGKERFKELMSSVFSDNISEYDFVDNLEIDDDGLISVYRAITLTKESSSDVFLNMVNRYKGIGLYWSWSEDGAVPHGGWKGVQHLTYYFHGKVRPEDILWPWTIYKNGYGMKYEKEIELREEVPILVEEVSTVVSGKKVVLNDRPYMSNSGVV
jgi:hypothetical protein